MHFVHFANVIGCNNMLMLKVCKNFCKLLHVSGAFISLSTLGKLADQALYFACVNFFFCIFYYEQSYLSTTGTIFTIF